MLPAPSVRILCLLESRLKRRNFLAASALLSLLAPSSVLAVNKKKAAAQDAAKPAAKSTAKPAGKTGSRDTTRTSGSRDSTRARHSYRRPVVEKPSTPPALASSPAPTAAVEQRNAMKRFALVRFSPLVLGFCLAQAGHDTPTPRRFASSRSADWAKSG